MHAITVGFYFHYLSSGKGSHWKFLSRGVTKHFIRAQSFWLHVDAGSKGDKFGAEKPLKDIVNIRMMVKMA